VQEWPELVKTCSDILWYNTISCVTD